MKLLCKQCYDIYHITTNSQLPITASFVGIKCSDTCICRKKTLSLLLQTAYNQGGKTMNATAIGKATVKVGVSSTADFKFLKELAKRMGWTFEQECRSGIDEAIDDLKAGSVHKAKDVDDLRTQLMK